MLDRLRIFNAEQKFLIGVRLLTGAIDASRAGKAFSDLADLTIGAALDAVLAEFAARHGRVRGMKVAILGMGKLGSRELTAGSDVDLILLYDHDAKAEESDGPKPLAAVALFHAPDAAPDRRRFGADRRRRALRARPAAAAVRQQGAGRHAHRVVPQVPAAGSLDLGAHGADARPRGRRRRRLSPRRSPPRSRRSWRSPHDRAKVMAEAVEMRAMIEKEKPPRDLWDLKLVPGGLIDLEFIAQVAVLTGGVARERSGRPAPAKSWRILRRPSPIPKSGRNWWTPIPSIPA